MQNGRKATGMIIVELRLRAAKDYVEPGMFVGAADKLTRLVRLSKLALLLAAALLAMTGCVSTPQGTKFDPIEGGRRLNENIDTTIDRLQDRSYHDNS